MDAQFYDLILSEPPMILGEPLQVLSIGHHAILTQVRSPFLGYGVPTLGDTLIAVGVCSRSFEDARHWILSPDAMKSDSAILGKRFKKNPAQILQMVADYFTTYAATPRLWNRSGKAASGYPVHLWMITTLLKHLQLPSESAAWNYPFALGYWHCIAAMDSAQNVMTDAAAKAIRELPAKQKAADSEFIKSLEGVDLTEMEEPQRSRVQKRLAHVKKRGLVPVPEVLG